MRICVTAPKCAEAGPPAWIPRRQAAGEAAPELALPWVIRLRYGLALGQVALLLTAHYGLRADLPLVPLAVPVAAMLLSNAWISRAGKSAADTRSWLGALFCLDVACLTAILALTGGPANPFTVLYLVEVTLSAVILNMRWTWLLATLSTFGFAVLFWMHKPLPILEPAYHGETHATHLHGMLLAFMVAVVLITVLIGKVTEMLRGAEREMLDLQERAAKNDRLASLVTLAAGAAHEMATPMGTIAVVAKELEHRAAGSGEDGLLEDARLVRSEVERCRRILQTMSSRETGATAEAAASISIDELMDGALTEFPPADRGRIRTARFGAPGTIVAPRQAIERALAALLRNALDADEGLITICAELGSGRVRFTVSDCGPGMPPAVLNHVAEPFYSTKQPGEGMGLGTFLTRMLAEQLGGTLVFDSSPGAGTSAMLELPVQETRAAAHAG